MDGLASQLSSAMAYAAENQQLVSLSLSTLAIATLARIVLTDYARWKAVGPGGMPYNAKGYLIQASLRPFAFSDLTSGVPYQALKSRSALEARRFLPALPVRAGPRPDLCPYTGPSRQANYPSPRKLVAEIAAATKTVAHDNARAAAYEESVMERGGPALFVQAGAAAKAPEHDRSTGAAERECFHVHESEGSCHAFLSAADAEELLAKGWGQRHPLSGHKLGKAGIGAGYVTLYAPRSAEELEIVKLVARAAVAYATDGKAEIV